jgi:hypothetical protein
LARAKDDPAQLREALMYIKQLEPFIRTMSRLVAMDQSHLLVKEFIESEDLEKSKASPIWNITSWHYLLHTYMTEDIESLEPFARVLNQADADYLMVVATMQNLTGINILIMPEEKNMSTTELLQRYSEEALIEAKKQTHEN